MTLADVIVFAPAAIIAAYATWRYLIAPAIGRAAGIIDRRRRPVTEDEYRAAADERAAREALRPYGSLEMVSTIDVPVSVNGHNESERA